MNRNNSIPPQVTIKELLRTENNTSDIPSNNDENKAICSFTSSEGSLGIKFDFETMPEILISGGARNTAKIVDLISEKNNLKELDDKFNGELDYLISKPDNKKNRKKRDSIRPEKIVKSSSGEITRKQPGFFDTQPRQSSNNEKLTREENKKIKAEKRKQRYSSKF